MKNINKILIAAIAGTMALDAGAELRITEVMQANISSYFVDNEFPDSWVELYNDGDTNFRLIGYRIGDTENFEDAVRIAGGAITRSHTYTVICCDKSGPVGTHIDYRLGTGKGDLYLFNPSGEIIDHVTLKKFLGPNVSYSKNASGKWGFTLTPTPGADNNETFVQDVLPDPVFNVPGKVIQNGARRIVLRVTVPDGVPADTRLYVTTDGSEPTTSSPSYSQEFYKSITSNTIVRAKLISSEAASPAAVTQSYIFHPRTTNLPIISINTDNRYFTDSEIGILAGENYKQNWRRPANVEYFTGNDEDAQFNMMGECRVHGAWTRENAQKSFVVYTQKRFGNKNFGFPFWEAKPDVKKVKSFILRNGGNCFGSNRIGDAAVQTLFGRNVPNLDYQENTAVIAYVNGQYRGIYDLRERSDEDHIESNYGIEDLDMVENYNELKEGSMQNFNDFVALYSGTPTLEQMQKAVDFDNFAKTVIAQAWATNTDWPGNNMVMWREASDSGKWRMLIKDMDFYGSNGINTTFFNHLLRANGHESDTGEGNTPASVKVFQTLWKFPEFRDIIIDNFSVYLGDFLRESVVVNHLNSLADEIDAEYPYHLNVYGNPTSYKHWTNSVKSLVDWSVNRTNYLRDNIIHSYFDLGKQVPVTVIPNGHEVSLNGVTLTQPDYIGYYYAGRTARVATPEQLLWKITITYSNGSKRTYTSTTNECEKPFIESMTSVTFELTDQPTGIEDLTDNVRDINVVAALGNVIVESTSAIAGVTVTDIAGRVVATVPAGTSFKVEIPVDGHGCYVVVASNASGKTVSRKVVL